MNAGELVGGEIIAEGPQRYAVNEVHKYGPLRGWKSIGRPGIGKVWIRVAHLTGSGRRESIWVMDIEEPVTVV